MALITIYTKPFCPYCLQAKRTLEEEGLSYKEIVLKTSEAFDELKEQTDHVTVPQIFVRETFIGGSDDLHANLERVKRLAKGTAQKHPAN